MVLTFKTTVEFKNKRIPFTVASTGITNRMYKKPHWQEEKTSWLFMCGRRVELENTKERNPAGVLRCNHGTT